MFFIIRVLFLRPASFTSRIINYKKFINNLIFLLNRELSSCSLFLDFSHLVVLLKDIDSIYTLKKFKINTLLLILLIYI